VTAVDNCMDQNAKKWGQRGTAVSACNYWNLFPFFKSKK